MVEVLSSEFHERVKRTRAKMKQAGLDALFIYCDEYHPGYAMYYTNFRTINCIEESAHALFLPLEGEIQAFTGNLNRFAARRFSWVKNVHNIYEMRTVLPELVNNAGYSINKIGVVGEELFPISLYREFERGVEGITLVEASEIVLNQRLIKSKNELDLLRAAGKLNDDSILASVEQLGLGKSEVELSAMGEYTTRKLGGELSCAYLVVAGEHTDLPTWRPGDYKVKPGDYVWFDYGASYLGYASDTAITVAMNGASEEQIKIMNFAYDTNQRMVEFMRPGIKGSDLFRETVRLTDEANLSKHLLPYTTGMRAIGHGVGLECVEYPDLGPKSEYPLEPGMVFGIKFDLHGFPFGGVRVEQTVIITETGSESVNDLSRLRNKAAEFGKRGGFVVG